MNRFGSLRPRRPSPAMVVALIALFVALGSGAYAAINLPANSVGTKQLKNGAVTRVKINAKGLTVPYATKATTLRGIYTYYGPAHSIAPGAIGGGTAACPAGSTLLSGGWQSGPAVNAGLLFNGPLAQKEWNVGIVNNSSTAITFQAIAVCTPRG
jgi:hypothetical protein